MAVINIDSNSNELASVKFSNEVNTSEKDLLINSRLSPSYVRPRMASVFFMVDSTFAGGITSRSNYMTRCFMNTWEYNNADTSKLHMLLWNADTSRQTQWKAFAGLLLQWLLAFVPSILFIKQLQDVMHFRPIAWTLFCLELSLILWHATVVYVVIHNRKSWKKAWFTFHVASGTIGLVDSGQSQELTLFHFSANIRFLKTTISDVTRLHNISKREQELLTKEMRTRNLMESEIILYTEDFLESYSVWPQRMASALFFSSFAGLAVVVYFLSCR